MSGIVPAMNHACAAPMALRNLRTIHTYMHVGQQGTTDSVSGDLRFDEPLDRAAVSTALLTP
jgi:hypothetical protein